MVIVAARAATQPQQRLRNLADEIGTAGLVALTADDPAAELRTVFSWSYRALPATAAALFRLLGVHAGPDLTGLAAASLIGAPQGQAHASLGDLLRAQLISEPSPGRYALHDLLHAYVELVHAYNGEKELRLAQRRLLDHYLHTAYTATMLISPNRDQIDLLPPQPQAAPVDLTDRRQAMDWFTAEHRVLLAAIEQAAAGGFDVHAWQLAWTTANVFHIRGQWHDMLATHGIALEAARRRADRAGEGHIHHGLGGAYARMARFDEAGTHYHRAIDLFREIGDHATEATCHLGLGSVRQRQHRYRDALVHAQRAHALYRPQGHLAGQARVLNNIGWLYALQGEYRKALAHCGQALETYRASGDLRGQAAALDSLAYAHHHLHEYREAVSLYRQAIELFQEVGDRLNEAETLTRLGETHVAAGEPDVAGNAWRLSLAIYRELERPDAEEVRNRLAAMESTRS